jgi:hypothetical protein
MSERVRFIPNPESGGDVLLIDLSGFVVASDSLPFILTARTTVAGQPPASVCCVVDVSESRFNTDVVEALKDLAAHNRPFVIASAVIGISGLMRVIMESVAVFSGRRNLKACASRAEAFHWLAAQVPVA